MEDKLLKTRELWISICNGDDRKAFELLFHQLNGRLIKFCTLYIRQREAAEEIVSDVFVKCWINRKMLVEIQNPETYLYVAVKNQSLNHIKKYSNVHLVELEDVHELKLVNSFDPEKEMEHRELVITLDQAINSLPQQCKIIFKLIKDEGMKYKEVAVILDISPRTVQTQLFRAIKKLSVSLQPYIKTSRKVINDDLIISIATLILLRISSLCL